MTDYTFETLHDKEFELLVRDLLQEETGLTFENFKSGKDGGIDLRYSECSDNNIIVQCKHWQASGLSALKSHLKNKELAKVKNLEPDRYIIATSSKLSPRDKEEIKQIFAPYILKESDVIGYQTLNNLLSKYRVVEEKHYKLWLSSISILKRIQNEYIRERSKLYADEIYDKVKLFVQTESYDIGEKILKKNKVLLITGEPGIGKTMLADFLIFKYLRDGFELTYIHKDLEDAEKVFDSEKKQIFYFDDFLGRNYLEVLSEKKFDSQLNHLIKAVVKSNNHYLILTSRTTIYNTARSKSDIISNKKFDNFNYLLEISHYNNLDKGKILYNHLFFSRLDDELKSEIKSNEFYLVIIKHKNFTPRIIEFITDKGTVDISRPENYSKFIYQSLEDPTTIWEKAFTNQISEIDQFFLLTLFSFKLPVEEEKFKKAFDERLRYEKANNGFKIPLNYYNASLYNLLDGFVKRHITKELVKLDFINPSIEDYFLIYIKKSKNDAKRIVDSAIFYEQISFRFIESTSLDKLFSFSELKPSIEKLIGKNKYIGSSIKGLINLFGINVVSKIFPAILKLILEKDHFALDSYIITFFLSCFEYSSSKNVLLDNKTNVIKIAQSNVDDIESIYGFKDLLQNLEVDSDKYIENNTPDILENLQDYIDDYFYDIHSEVEFSYYEWGGDVHMEHNIELVLESKLEYLLEDLGVLGFDWLEIEDISYTDYTDVDKVLESMNNDGSVYMPKVRANDALSVNDETYLKNLFS